MAAWYRFPRLSAAHTIYVSRATLNTLHPHGNEEANLLPPHNHSADGGQPRARSVSMSTQQVRTWNVKAFSDAAQTAQPKIYSKQRLNVLDLRQRGAERCGLCNCLDRQAIRTRKHRNPCVCCTALCAYDVHQIRRVKAAPRQYWVKWIERCIEQSYCMQSNLGPAGSAELARVSSLPRAAAGNNLRTILAEPLGGV